MSDRCYPIDPLALLERAEKAEAELQIQIDECAKLHGWVNSLSQKSIHERKKDKEIARLKKNLATFHGALAEIANDGCGLMDDKGNTCIDSYPSDRSEWCWCCIAREALARKEGK